MRTLAILTVTILGGALLAAPVPKGVGVDPLGKGYMGIYPATDDTPAIDRVIENTPASRIGLARADRFLRVGPVDKPRSFTEIRNWIKSQRPGTQVELTIGRGTQEFKTVIVLGVHPDPQELGGIIERVPGP